MSNGFGLFEAVRGMLAKAGFTGPVHVVLKDEDFNRAVASAKDWLGPDAPDDFGHWFAARGFPLDLYIEKKPGEEGSES